MHAIKAAAGLRGCCAKVPVALAHGMTLAIKRLHAISPLSLTADLPALLPVDPLNSGPVGGPHAPQRSPESCESQVAGAVHAPGLAAG